MALLSSGYFLTPLVQHVTKESLAQRRLTVYNLYIFQVLLYVPVYRNINDLLEMSISTPFMPRMRKNKI